jgi:hypothetical protein
MFAGFNLLLLSPALRPDGNLSYDSLLVTNHGSGGKITSRFLSTQERSCGGVSNGVDGAGGNEWPKINHASHDIGVVLRSSLTKGWTETNVTDHLFEVLA